MHAADKAKAIKFLRSIAVVAIGAAEVLEGSRGPSSVLSDGTDEVIEALSLIEGDIEKIEKLELWTEAR